MTLENNSGTKRAWTDRLTTILLLAIFTMVFSDMAVTDGSRAVWAELLIVGFVIAASLRAGAAGGIVVGLAGAAAHIGLNSIDGGWGHQSAAFSVAAVATFIAYGWLFGLSAAHLRRRQAAEAGQPAAAGAGGSQGLLTAAEGRALLDMETEQARLSGNDLAIITVRATVREGTHPQAARHAFRAVARTFEASASGRMHPILLAENELAMVLPGGDSHTRALFEQAVMAAMAEATYADRGAGTRSKASAALRLASTCMVLTDAPAKVEALFITPNRRVDQAALHTGAPAKAAA
ncbi:hypothetical protein AB0N33_17980 [Pseudarthrobacter oxydans]|uniref:hypothetical protein n=1 Tax=Pseudarthrobacter oxydans TaxID=1671 RepID=UPI003414BA62